VTIFYCPRFETSLFVATYDSQGSLRFLKVPFSSPHTTRRVTVEVLEPASTRAPEQLKSQCPSYATTDGSAGVGLGIKHPSGAYDQIFICQRVTGLLIWGALSDERTVLSFSISMNLLIYVRTKQKISFPTIPLLLFALSFAAETCFPSRCLSIYVSSGSTNPSFRRDVTILFRRIEA
jgi:hypothetical protein